MTDTDTDLIASYWLHAGETEPFVGRDHSLWDFQERVEVLAETGFDGVGIYHADLVYLLDEDGYSLERIRDVLAENDMEYVELEFMTQWMLDEDAERRVEEEPVLERMLEAADVLDARHLKVANSWGYELTTDELRTAFEELCDRARGVGVDVGYELLAADPVVETIDDAVEVTETSSNGGLFLDNWHLVKMGVTNDEISALSADDIVAVEFEDGIVDADMEFFEETVNHRKLPGEGEFDVEGFIAAAKAAGFDGPWGMEILSAEYRDMPMESAYATAYEAARRYVG